MPGDKEVKIFSRRDFLKTTGAATGGIIGGSLLGGFVGFNLNGNPTEELATVEASSENSPPASEDNNHQEARMFFRRSEDFNVLSAATEMIYPEDDNGPGAIALGVPFFIDKQLVTSWGMNALDYMQGPFQEGETALTRQKIFSFGVRRLNSYSEEEFDSSFTDLEDDQKIEVLQSFESDEVDMDYIDSSTFFNLLRQTTIEGVFSDPLYGGNKNMDGWKMIGFPGAQLTYRHMMEEDSPVDEEFTLIDPVSLSSNSL